MQAIKVFARQFFDTELRALEERLRRRRQGAELGADPIGFQFAQIRESISQGDLLRQARAAFVEYVCCYEPKVGDPCATDKPGREGDSKEPWNVRLKKTRESLSLSRQQAANKLGGQLGAPITVDAIKKHEEGKHMPRPKIRKAYAAAYETPESELFSQGDSLVE